MYAAVWQKSAIAHVPRCSWIMYSPPMMADGDDADDDLKE